MSLAAPSSSVPFEADIDEDKVGRPLRVGTSFVGPLLRDVTGVYSPRMSYDVHLRSAIEWLLRAADASPDDGISYGYSIQGGWRPSYRETSGYIVVTLFDLAARLGDPKFAAAARSVSRWLCEVQEHDGSIANPIYGTNRGIVFDTGQVLLAYVRAYRETGEVRFLEAAGRASSWLACRLDADGAWRRNTHLGNEHTYNARVAWAMLECHAVAPDPSLEAAARRNLDWAVSQERDGYFKSCAFKPGVAPYTHTIAYAIRGFLESARLLGEPKYQQVAVRAADAVLRHVRDDGWIPGHIDETGAPTARYCCLTGSCQLAIIWLKLHQTTGSARYLDAAQRSLGFVMRCQDTVTSNSDVRGAIKGSHPIWGRYAPLSYPSWAAKFFIDAVLLLKELTR